MSGEVTAGFIRPLTLEMAAQGEYVIESPEPLEEGPFATLVLTGFQNKPSIYSGFNFNSYAKHRGKSYGAKNDGIYILEGEDDAGTKIHPGMRLGPHNFGTDREKKLRILRFGGNNEGARVKVSSNGCVDYSEMKGNLAFISHSFHGREITVEITDFATLDHFELTPHVLVKR
jgi:hypothetical protein